MKVLSHVNKAKRLKEDPIGYVIDIAITFIVNIFSPVKVPPEVISQLKMPILGFLLTMIVLFVMLIMFVGSIFLFPATIGGNLLNSIASLIPSNSQPVPNDASFISTKVPRQNPFGGSNLSYTTISANFLDPAYFIQFGKNHTGTDFVPSQNYYDNSETYKEFKKVVIFATMNGSVRYYVDGHGGKAVEIINNDSDFKTVYMHFDSVFLESGEVVAGTPLGIMGDTGFSTGPHLHYEVWTKDNNSWKAVNPLNYIQ